MKVLNKINVPGRTILSVDEDVLALKASKVIINGVEYKYDIAYDMKNTIGVKAEIKKIETIAFLVE